MVLVCGSAACTDDLVSSYPHVYIGSDTIEWFLKQSHLYKTIYVAKFLLFDC